MQDNLIKYIDNLQVTTAAKEKMQSELDIAKNIQQSILPHNFPEMKEFEIYAALLPAREVSGDLYDFFMLDDEHFCFAIGDVSGKGVPASLFMAITKTLLRAKIKLSRNSAEVMKAINEEVSRENESMMFVTFLLCILNIKTGELEYCNAVHNPPLVHTAEKGFYYLRADVVYPPLGVSQANYESLKLKLHPEDIFFMYTDGITEAMSSDFVEFSEEKLIEVITRNKEENVVSLVNNVKSAVQGHASGADQSDDITIVALKYNGA